MVYDNRYSRFVAWAKILLPLAAIGILSTLFLFSHKLDPSAAIPFAKVNVEELADEQRIGGPKYFGKTADGTAISLTALTARPDPDNSQRLLVAEMTANMAMSDGSQIDLTALRGQLDTGAGAIVLEGDVVVETSAGYRVLSQRLDAAMNRTEVISPGTVTATGPAGNITADMMELREGANGYVLVFNGHVKLVYVPGD